MAKIIDGKEVAASVLERVKAQVAQLAAAGVTPCLAVIIVGDDPASKIYVRKKHEMCGNVGIVSKAYELAADVEEGELIALIRKLNSDASVTGILCQLPLPAHISERNVLRAVSPDKDVDAFSARIGSDPSDMASCTPAGIIEMLKYENIEIRGKSCVVLGRSSIVGKPMALLLLQNDGTVTICHSKTKELKAIASGADILVSAVGKAKFVTADMVKPGAVVIDVGMNRDENGKLCGDVDFDNVEPIASYITKVPGGVGPMTIAMLMQNTVTAARLQRENS